MPELPEVETVRRGLAPYLEGARIDKVTLNRKDLRFPFPKGFIKALEGQTIASVGRRAKYLLFRLSSGKIWLGHLGMTGAFRFAEGKYKEPSRYYEPGVDEKHDHVVMHLTHPGRGKLTLIYSDARRFGFMGLFDHEEDSPYLEGLGPEPLGNEFNAGEMAVRFKGKAAPIKPALLDQRVVAGLGNIYVSEALWRAHIRPTVPAGKLVLKSGKPSARLDLLAGGVEHLEVARVDVFVAALLVGTGGQGDAEPGQPVGILALLRRDGMMEQHETAAGVGVLDERVLGGGRDAFVNVDDDSLVLR